MSKPTFRRATVDDAAHVAAVVVDSIRETCGPAYDNDKRVIGLWCADKTPDKLAHTIALRDNYTVVGVVDDRIVGVGLLQKFGEIALCYVQPGHQGLGVGDGMLSIMERKAKALGLKSMILKSTLNAVSFYQRHGYKENGEVELFMGEIRFQPMRKVISRRLRILPAL